jgi:hypothetical protein
LKYQAFRPPCSHSTSWPELPFAIGLIETQGLTAVSEAIDTACKAGDVEILGREKLGGGYITMMIKGDVAAVKAAIDAGHERIESAAPGQAHRRTCDSSTKLASSDSFGEERSIAARDRYA